MSNGARPTTATGSRRAPIQRRVSQPLPIALICLLRSAAARTAVARGAGERQGGANAGIVVPAVLLTVLVMVLSLVAIASRVASSREEAALGAMANAAREAADYGFSEIVAEMNRDVNSYRWLTTFSGGAWQGVSRSDLAACGVESPAESGTFPASREIASNRFGQLSYALRQYTPPQFAPGADPAASFPTGHPCRSVWRNFGNLLGGTGTLTILGQATSPSGQVTTYTLTRNVSVRRKAPIEAVTSLWSNYPFSSSLAQYTPEPALRAPDFTPSPLSLTSNARLNSTTYSQPRWGGACRLGDSVSLDSSGPVSTQILRCWYSSLSVSGGAELKIEVGDLKAVEIYLTGSGTVLDIADGSSLHGDDPLKWSRLRIYGSQAGSCSSAPQDLNLGLVDIDLTTKVVNLYYAFLLFPSGRINFTAASLPTSPYNLAGVACGAGFPNLTAVQVAGFQATMLSSSMNSSLSLFSGLGGPYGFSSTGVFGGSDPIRFTYRGVGFSDP